MNELVIPFSTVMFWVVFTAVLFFLLGAMYSSSKRDGELTWYPANTDPSKYPYTLRLDLSDRELSRRGYLVLKLRRGWVEEYRQKRRKAG